MKAVVVSGVGCGLGLVTGGAWPGFIAAVRQEPEHSERRQKMGILVQEDFVECGLRLGSQLNY